MSDVLSEFKLNSKKLKEIQSQISKDIGKKEQLLLQLKEKFNINTIEEARKFFVDLEEKFDVAEKDMVRCKEEMDQIISTAATAQSG